MKRHFLSPTNDIVFKKIFWSEERKHLLISFLNSVIKFEWEEKIKSLTILDPYQVPKIKDLKETILDIKAVNEKWEEFIVEMQVQNKWDFTKRSLFYTAKAYSDQLKKWTDYEQLKPIYFVGVMWYILFPDPRDEWQYLSKHIIKNAETNTHEIKDFSLHFLELPKFNKKLDELDWIIDQRAYFFKNTDQDIEVPESFDELLLEAFEVVDEHNFTKREMNVIDLFFYLNHSCKATVGNTLLRTYQN